MRKIILFIVALMMAQTSMAQRDDYPELYKSLGSMRDFEAYWTLFQYLQRTTSRDFANSNAYYQVGLYMQKFMQNSDPFLDARNLQDFIEQGHTYFSLAKRALDEREVRRQSDFYPAIKPAGQRLTMEDVVRDIDERLAAVEEFKKRFEESNSFLVKTVNSYNNCITIFAEINRQNNRLNDLYFLADNQLKGQLKELGANFDTTLLYLDKLKVALEEYPLGGYKINYSLRQIPVYRLYGLNSSDFLSGNSILWDFRSWVNDFNQIMETDVAFLYNSVQEVNSLNKVYVTKLLNDDTNEIPSDYKINPLIVNKMLKYDFNSATAALLMYQEAKVNYLFSIAGNKIGADLSSFDRFSKSPDAFLSMVRHKQKTDELLASAKEKTTPESIKKYAQFYQNNFGGYNGFLQYLNRESGENEEAFQKALNAYKNRVLRMYMISGAGRNIHHNNKPVYLQIASPATLEASAGYYIHSKSQLTDKSMFVSGTHVANNQKIAFAALIDSAGTVKWLKEFRQSNVANHGVLTAQLNEGFAVVVSAMVNNEVRNRILLLDAAGNTKTTKDLAGFSSVPQRLIYDDIAQTYVLALKGKSFMPFSGSNEPLQICMLDAKLDVQWNKSLIFDGYLANLIKTDDNYYVYGTYSRLMDEHGREYVTNANRVNMFVFPISADGSWLNFTAFNAPFSYYPLNVVKINNEFVDVISIKDAQPDRLIESRTIGGAPYYMIIHANRDVYYQNNQ